MSESKFRRVCLLSIVLVLILLWIPNVCSGQFTLSEEYYFTKSINPELFDLVCIQVDGKMKKIKKNQPQYEIIRNPQTLFNFQGLFEDKNNTKFFVFNHKEVKYYFPHYNKKSVDYGFTDYAVNFTSSFVQRYNYISQTYNYIDAKKASSFLGTEFKNENFLYDRFLKVDWKGIELTKEQNVKFIFRIADKDFSIDFDKMVANYLEYFVSNSKMADFNSLNDKVNNYKTIYTYYDIQKDKSIKIKNQSDLICDRFYPMSIKDVIADDRWNGKIRYVIDGEVHVTANDYLRYCAPTIDNINKCKSLFEFVENAKEEYKRISVFFDDENKIVSLSDTTWIYGKPMDIIRAETDINYNEYVRIRVDSREYRLKLDDFKQAAINEEKIQENLIIHKERVRLIEEFKSSAKYVNIAAFSEDFKKKIEGSKIVLCGELIPIKLLDLVMSYNRSWFKLSVNTMEYSIRSDEMVKYSHSFAITSCSVANTDGNKTLPFDDVHTKYLRPTIKYNNAHADSYQIDVKLYDSNGNLSTGKSSPSGYTNSKVITIPSGVGSVELTGWGSDQSGNWEAGNYRYEFYHHGDLIYTHEFTIPECKTGPFTITACSVANTDGNGNKLPFAASYIQYLQPSLKFTNAVPGTYQIDVRLCDDAPYGYIQSSNSPENYTYSYKVTLSSKNGTVSVGQWGNSNPRKWKACGYNYEFFYKGKLLYNYYFSIPEYSYEYVDLGLPSGTLWCTCNVGAKTPWDYGDYFAWGEITTKSRYGENNYKFSNANFTKLGKYCTESEYGFNGLRDNLTMLQKSDDVATVKMGSEWRMPTGKEFQELIDYCTWRWTSNYEGHYVSGFIIKSRKYSDRHIFLPAAGGKIPKGLLYYEDDDIKRGYYWSVDLFQSYYNGTSLNAVSLNFVPNYMEISSDPRYIGLSVRAVRRK